MKWRPITNQRNYKKSRGGSSTFSYYSVRYFLLPTVAKPEAFSSAKLHSLLTTTCPCHHESPNDLTRKYDFYVYPNSIMTFFSKVNISHFLTTRKRLIIYQPLINLSLFSFIRFLSYCNLVFHLVKSCTSQGISSLHSSFRLQVDIDILGNEGMIGL